MSSEPPFKRRKVADNNRILSKPFVSPLKNPRVARSVLLHSNHGPPAPYQPSILAHTTTVTPAVPPAETEPENLDRTTAKLTPIRKTLPSSTAFRTTDPAEIAAQRALTALELQIRTLRREIDTLKQAARLSSSTTDTNLAELAQKWKIASQAAADELFGTVKERVDRMGGVTAWRKNEAQTKQPGDGFGEFEKGSGTDGRDCRFDSDGEELPEAEQERRKSERREMEKDTQDAADSREQDEQWEQNGSQPTDNEDNTFTMDMMLQSLNVPLDAIGYDKVAEQWLA